MKKTIMALVSIALLLSSISLISATPIPPLTIAGHLKDRNGYPIGGWKVYSKNIRTGETINNGTFNVTSTDGYQIQWGNSVHGWQVGDILKVWAWYHDGNRNYTASQQVTVPTDIQQQGSLILIDLTMNVFVGTITNDTGNTSEGRTNDAFIVYGIVTKDGIGTNGITVTVKNIYTGNYSTNRTYSNGDYRVNIGSFKKGWKAGDKIKINASYQNYAGDATFIIPPATAQRKKDLALWLVVENPAQNSTHEISFAELFSLYNTTKLQLDAKIVALNAAGNRTKHLQNEIDGLNDNVSSLQQQLKDQKGNLPWLYIMIIAALAAAVAFLFYKWWTYRAMLIESAEEQRSRSRTNPIRRQ